MEAQDPQEIAARAEDRTLLWMKIAGVAFAMWSVMIPVGVSMLNESVANAVASNERFNTEFKQYVLSMERRVTILEERQGAVIQMIQIQKEQFQKEKERPR